MTVIIEQGASLAVPLDALKAYLRIGLDEEDAALTGLIRVASDAAEQFLGQLLIARTVDEIVGSGRGWQTLAIGPVRSITSVAGIPADGPEFALPVDNHAIDIDAHGTGWVRVSNPGAAGRIRVRYRAGIAEDDSEVPEAIRHGIIRLAGEHHAQREGLEPQLPASVAALWRPWRRVRIA